jgi:hypothetical protein
MFRSDMTAVSVFDTSRAARPRPSFRPVVEALEERVVLDATVTPGVSEAAVLAYDLAQAATSMALRLQNSNPHLSKKGLGNLLKTEQSFRQIIQVIEASMPQGSAGCQQVLQAFHQADMVLVQEVTALANGHKIPTDVSNQAIALGQTINEVNQALADLAAQAATPAPAPSAPCSSSSCMP